MAPSTSTAAAFAGALGVASGAPPSEALLAFVRAAAQQRWGFEALRAAADVLAAPGHAARAVVALGTEFFRSQQGFNDAVLEVLEDLPWLASAPGAAAAVSRRLGPHLRFAARPPRRAGLRGTATLLLKHGALLVAERAGKRVLEELTRANTELVAALGAVAGSDSSPEPPLRRARAALEQARFPGLAPWLDAQRRFVLSLEQFVLAHGAQLRSRAAAVRALGDAPAPAPAAGHPSVSVLLVGAWPRVPAIDGALEILCERVPPDSPAHARAGDVADARGEVVLRLPATDALAPHGLAALAAPFQNPQVQLSYGDCLLPDGTAHFRPGWSPELVWSSSWLGGCFAMRAGAAQRAHLGRSQPALAWLLATPWSEAQVVRVPALVSRGRPAPPSVADALVVETALARRGLQGTVRVKGALREVHLEPRPGTRVTLIVPFRDKVELLEGLWASLLRHRAGVDWELVLVSNQSTERRTLRFLRGLRDPRVQWFEWNRPFNYSALNNAAARRGSGDLLLFLNNDVAVRHDDWLSGLAGYAQQPEIGVAGARLLYGDDSVQHAGVVIGLRGLAGHVFSRWRPEFGSTPFGPPAATRNWSAVTGACLMLRRELFVALGGFDERLVVSGSDVALCLKARARGLRVVCVGHVALSHFESKSRGRAPVPRGDVLGEFTAYRALLEAGDPYYHPLLSTEAAHGGPGLRLEQPAEHALRALLPWLGGDTVGDRP